LTSVIEFAATSGAPEVKGARQVISEARSNEIFFGVVGPVGAGSSRVMTSLQRAASQAGYACELIKASDLIRAWATEIGHKLPAAIPKLLANVRILQDLGDEMRSTDASAVAKAIVQEIARRRASATGQTYVRGEAVSPDTEKRAYFIDSIRHPAEINLLRRTYANAFALVGVVCQPEERERRVLGKYFSDPERRRPEVKKEVADFIDRDADDQIHSYGQHVTDAFHVADFFVDNTQPDPDDHQHLLDESLGRLLNIVVHDRIIRPTIEETAMHHAQSARVRSACLSRQVGAALIDSDGTVIATGVNEVPRAGGGVYGENFRSNQEIHDDRCAFRETPFCSSNKEQNRIVEELISQIPELSVVSDKNSLAKLIRKTRLGQLIEFSRAVHAEMDALLSAGREGASTIGTRLFVTTFPCHYCARHIVSAGVYEVQYIEPYPKSRAIALHSDAIETNGDSWTPPEEVTIAEERRREKDGEDAPAGKVLFRPFVGVAPRLYIRAFEKIRQLKNKDTGDLEMAAPEWGDEWAPFTVAYPELEAKLT